MKELIEKVLITIKIHVRNNLKIINENNYKIFMLSHDNSNRQNEEINQLSDINNKLKEENKDCINMHLELKKFLNKYKENNFNDNTVYSEISDYLKEDEIFNLTISNKLPLNLNNPALQNDVLLNKLIDYFSKNEDYEKCNEILKLKNKKSLENKFN